MSTNIKVPPGTNDRHPSPRVSVVIPTYRRNHFLRNALRSVLAQRFTDFEVIVSDNAADPDTQRLVAGLSDDRLKYRCNSPTADAFENHLAGWRVARGEYIAFLHDDDEWDAAFLSTLVDALDGHPECAMAFSEQLIIGPSGEPLPLETQQNKARWNRDKLAEGIHQPFWGLLVHQSIPMVMGSMFRSSALRPDDVVGEARTALDFWMAYVICRSGAGAYFVRDPLMHYRSHEAQETAHPSNCRMGAVYCWDHVLKESAVRPYRKIAHTKAAEAHTHVATLLLQQGHAWRARWHALRAAGHRITPRRAGLLILSWLPNSIGCRLVNRLLHSPQHPPSKAPPGAPPILPRGRAA